MPEAFAVVFRSTDNGLSWEPMKQEDVPDFVKNEDAMANLLNDPSLCVEGQSIVISARSGEERKPIYRAERIAS